MNFWLKNKKNNLLIILLIIIFLLSFYSAVFSSTFRKGFPAPSFILKSLEGEIFDLRDFKEQQKLLILYFYSQDKDNQDSLKGIDKLDKYFKDHITQEKYEIFLINVQSNLQEEDVTLIKKYLSDNKIIFPVLLDDKNEVSKLYTIEMLPTAIFLDKNLVVKRVYPGLISKQQTIMFQYINYLLDCREKESSIKKEKKKEEECEDGCGPPPGW